MNPRKSIPQPHFRLKIVVQFSNIFVKQFVNIREIYTGSFENRAVVLHFQFLCPLRQPGIYFRSMLLQKRKIPQPAVCDVDSLTGKNLIPGSELRGKLRFRNILACERQDIVALFQPAIVVRELFQMSLSLHYSHVVKIRAPKLRSALDKVQMFRNKHHVFQHSEQL